MGAGGVVKLSGMWGSSVPLVAAAVGVHRNKPLLFVCSHLDDADAAADDVEVATGMPVEVFPAWEFGSAQAGAGLGPTADRVSDKTTGERLRLCNLLVDPALQTDEPIHFMAAPIMALMQPVPSPATLESARLGLRVGGEISPEALAEWLVDAGFDGVDAVDQQGEFARRGGIVDVFPAGTDQPVRVEFFGYRIDSIRTLDLDNQRSTGQIRGYELVAISAGRETDPARTTHLLEYLRDDSIVCMIEPAELVSLAQTFYRRL